MGKRKKTSSETTQSTSSTNDGAAPPAQVCSEVTSEKKSTTQSTQGGTSVDSSPEIPKTPGSIPLLSNNPLQQGSIEVPGTSKENHTKPSSTSPAVLQPASQQNTDAQYKNSGQSEQDLTPIQVQSLTSSTSKTNSLIPSSTTAPLEARLTESSDKIDNTQNKNATFEQTQPETVTASTTVTTSITTLSTQITPTSTPPVAVKTSAITTGPATTPATSSVVTPTAKSTLTAITIPTTQPPITEKPAVVTTATVQAAPTVNTKQALVTTTNTSATVTTAESMVTSKPTVVKAKPTAVTGALTVTTKPAPITTATPPPVTAKPATITTSIPTVVAEVTTKLTPVTIGATSTATSTTAPEFTVAVSAAKPVMAIPPEVTSVKAKGLTTVTNATETAPSTITSKSTAVTLAATSPIATNTTITKETASTTKSTAIPIKAVPAVTTAVTSPTKPTASTSVIPEVSEESKTIKPTSITTAVTSTVSTKPTTVTEAAASTATSSVTTKPKEVTTASIVTSSTTPVTTKQTTVTAGHALPKTVKPTTVTASSITKPTAVTVADASSTIMTTGETIKAASPITTKPKEVMKAASLTTEKPAIDTTADITTVTNAESTANATSTMPAANDTIGTQLIHPPGIASDVSKQKLGKDMTKKEKLPRTKDSPMKQSGPKSSPPDNMANTGTNQSSTEENKEINTPSLKQSNTTNLPLNSKEFSAMDVTANKSAGKESYAARAATMIPQSQASKKKNLSQVTPQKTTVQTNILPTQKQASQINLTAEVQTKTDIFEATVAESVKEVTTAVTQKFTDTSTALSEKAQSIKEENISTKETEVCSHAVKSDKPSKQNKAKKTKQAQMDTVASKTNDPAIPQKLKSENKGDNKGLSKTVNASVKQTETQNKGSTSSKAQEGTGILNLVQEVIEVIGKQKSGQNDMTRETQKQENLNTSSVESVLLESPTKIPIQSSENTTTSKNKSSAKQDSNSKPKSNDTEEDVVLESDPKKASKKTKSKRKAKSNEKCTKANEDKEHESVAGTNQTSENELLKSNKESKAINHESKANNTQKPQSQISTEITDLDDKIKDVMDDSGGSKNKRNKKKGKLAKNKDIQIDSKSETNDKSKKNTGTKGGKKDLISGQINQQDSLVGDIGEKNMSEELQNDNVNSVSNTTNTEDIQDESQKKKKKKNRRRKGKQNTQEDSEIDVVGENSASVEKKLLNKEPKKVQGKDKSHKNKKSEECPKTVPIKNAQPGVSSGDSTQSSKKVSGKLSEEQLTHLTRTAVHLSQSLGESERSEMSFTPDVMRSILAPKPTDITSTGNEEEIEYRLVQRQMFLSYVCHVCKSFESSNCSLKKCNNCKMISYCSKKHQREHWSAHKDLCKAISKICTRDDMANLFQKAVELSPEEFRNYRGHYVNECVKELGRELDLWEKEMIYYPQVCHTCYEFDIQKLTICQKCHHVSYCQLSHLKADHEVWCKDFQIYRDITLYQFQHGMIQPSIPERMFQQYSPLTGDMKTFLLNTLIISEKSLLLNRLNLVTLTDIATCPLTVLFSLQNSNFPLENTNSLTVHLVGAEMHFEVDTIKKWEMLLLHLIPSLKSLQVVFIGPELKVDSILIKTLSQNKMCKDCNTVGKKATYEFWPGLYHEFLKSEKYQVPHLICAFNAGLYRLSDFDGRDTWSPSIEVMLKDPSIPVVVTEYTDKELPLDIERIENIVGSIEKIMPPSKNPFASSKPSLNFLSEETVPVIFKNFYLTIIKRAKI